MGLVVLNGLVACIHNAFASLTGHTEQARTVLDLVACIPNAFASLTGHTEQARTVMGSHM